jgi:adenylate cyclase
MKPRASGRKDSRFWLSGGVASALTALLGALLLQFPIGGSVTRLSFDLPFALRSDLAVTNVAIVYLDEASHRDLNQPMTAPWDRSLHAKLIEQQTAQGAKAIVFDILFTDPSSNPAADDELASAIKKSGRVILAGNYQQPDTTQGAKGRWEELPYEPFRNAAAGWGNANFPVHPDYGIREFFPTLHDISGQKTVLWLPGAVARFAGVPDQALRSEGTESRWLNYYGPPRTIPADSFFRALQPDGVPPGFFKDKIVFVGAQLSADFSGKGKDEFLTPYAYWGKGFAPGVEIHATAALNLLRGDWLNRLPPTLELSVVLLFALLAGYGLIHARPLAAVLITLAGIALVAAAALWLVWHWNYWFAWLILVCELWVALLCSVVYNSLRLYVEKKLLEQSLAAHLSPALVKRVLSDPSLRRRGGVKQEVSLLFTDIENFSHISETMHPDDLVNLLNQYFEAALKCIHELDGTVMDLVGDAIFVIWNAPVEQPDHRERACRAALKLRQQLMEFDAAQTGFPLRTRVGLHTGVVCVGNVGSEQRFDYAAVGENTNLASRLEGLNRHLGTAVLATREIQRVVEDKMTTRLIGHFQVKGFVRAIEIHELLGPREMAEPSRPWREKFAEALQQFRKRQFDAAENTFRETMRLRRQIEGSPANGGDRSADDGPSLFYLNKISELRVSPPPNEWIGEVAMKEK